MATNSTTALQLDNPFWHFALQIWQHDTIEHICMALQGEGLSINRLLFCLWLAGQHKPLPEHCTAADDWQQQISNPLRHLRFKVRKEKATQAELADVYTALRNAELASEQVEIAKLWQHAQQLPTAIPEKTRLEHASDNLTALLKRVHKDHLMQQTDIQQLLAHWQKISTQY